MYVYIYIYTYTYIYIYIYIEEQIFLGRPPPQPQSLIRAVIIVIIIISSSSSNIIIIIFIIIIIIIIIASLNPAPDPGRGRHLGGSLFPLKNKQYIVMFLNITISFLSLEGWRSSSLCDTSRASWGSLWGPFSWGGQAVRDFIVEFLPCPVCIRNLRVVPFHIDRCSPME